MAGEFRDRIDALTGIVIVNGTDSDNDITDWLTDGLKQITGILPSVKLEECVKTLEVTSSTGFDLDVDVTYGPVLSVTRKDTSGIEQTCRKVPKFLSSRVADPDDLMFSSTTDPVYYMDDAVVKILPDPNGTTQQAYVTYIALTAVANSATSIDNFPDEVEYAVVLYASIKAAQSLLASEEDDDLYIPMINTLKADYVQAINLLGGKLEQPKKSTDNSKQMQKMMNQMLEYGK